MPKTHFGNSLGNSLLNIFQKPANIFRATYNWHIPHIKKHNLNWEADHLWANMRRVTKIAWVPRGSMTTAVDEAVEMVAEIADPEEMAEETAEETVAEMGAAATADDLQ